MFIHLVIVPSNIAMQGTACQRRSASLRTADAAPDRGRWASFERHAVPHPEGATACNAC